MLKIAVAIILLSASFFMMNIPAHAFEVQPMRHSLYPSAGQNTSILTVRNTRSKPLPVELIVEKRVFGDNGVQTQVPANDDFVVFPFQALIEPGATQAFRFQYIGDQLLAEEAAYTIHVREVPVDLEEGFTGLRYIYSFGVAVYIENSEMQSSLSVRDITREEDALTVALENSGSSFARLANDRVILTQGEQSIVLEGETLMGIIDGVVIPPNNSLPVTIDLSGLELAQGEIDVALRETSD